jgi:cytochrome c oxidase subunit 4
MFSVTKNFTPADGQRLEAEQRRYFIFFNLAVALASITFIELILIILPFQGWLLITALIVLSLAKFGGVIWYFMHLRWDKYLLTLLFMLGLSLAAGTVAALLLLFHPDPNLEPPQIGNTVTAEGG